MRIWACQWRTLYDGDALMGLLPAKQRFSDSYIWKLTPLDLRFPAVPTSRVISSLNEDIPFPYFEESILPVADTERGRVSSSKPGKNPTDSSSPAAHRLADCRVPPRGCKLGWHRTSKMSVLLSYYTIHIKTTLR